MLTARNILKHANNISTLQYAILAPQYKKGLGPIRVPHSLGNKEDIHKIKNTLKLLQHHKTDKSN